MILEIELQLDAAIIANIGDGLDMGYGKIQLRIPNFGIPFVKILKTNANN